MNWEMRKGEKDFLPLTTFMVDHLLKHAVLEIG